MSSPALAIGYMLWLRMRWGMAATSVYLVCLIVSVQLVPNAGEPVFLAVLILIASVTHLLQVFTLGPADLGAMRSGYPANMFALPTQTSTLVGWPMLYAAAVHVSLWLIVAYFVLKPAGISPPVWWPAAVIAAFTAWVQAIGWAPFPIPFARVPALAIAMIPVILMGTWAGVYLESKTVSALVVAGMSVWIACAYLFAVHGLSRARSGNEGHWDAAIAATQRVAGGRIWSVFFPSFVIRRANPRHLAKARPAQRPFRSAAAAQLWHECRRNATYLPAMVAFMGLPLLVLNCFAVINPASDRTLLFGSVAISPAAMTLLMWIAIPLIFATSIGSGAGKFDFLGKEPIPAFFAVRPMTTRQFIALKLAAVAVSVCACWAIVFTFVGVWALIEASPWNPHVSLVRSTLAELTRREFVIACLVPVCLIAATWRTIVTGMWTSLAGRKWLSVAVGIAMVGQLTIAVLAGGWVYRHPEVQHRLSSAVPWLLGSLFVLKLCIAAGALAVLQKLLLIETRTATTILGCWAGAVAGILAMASCFARFSWQMAALAVLVVPLVRILVAPLALSFNRHR